MKCKHSTLIYLSGIIWFSIGTFLMMLGLNLLLDGVRSPASTPLISALAPYAGGGEQVVIALITLGLFVGFLKGRFVLGKSAQRISKRITQFPEPVHIKDIYSMPYYFLIAGMMCLGISIKYFGIPSDIRGAIDVAIGAALINGALVLYRMGSSVRNANCEVR